MTHAELIAKIDGTANVSNASMGTLLRALRRVAELHAPREGHPADCRGCNMGDDVYAWWPCPTWEAVAEAFK